MVIQMCSVHKLKVCLCESQCNMVLSCSHLLRLAEFLSHVVTVDFYQITKTVLCSVREIIIGERILAV
jgi:hypothetical protein